MLSELNKFITSYLSVVMLVLFAFLSWNASATQHSSYRYDVNHFSVSNQNHGYDIASTLLFDGVHRLIESSDENPKGRSFFAFVGGLDVTKGPLARGRVAESRVLNDLGLPKNTQKVRTSE